MVDGLRAAQGERDQRVLFQLVGLGRAGCRARRSLPADGAHRQLFPRQSAQARFYEALRAHVGRLFLHPHQFARIAEGPMAARMSCSGQGIHLVEEENRRTRVIAGVLRSA